MTRRDASSAETCPLCDATDLAPEGGCSYEELFRALRDELGARFAPDTVAENSPAERTTLLRCRACGFEHFAPLKAGTERFYSELGATSAYYEPAKWEFDRVIARLGRGESLLDVGTGAGAFLELCRSRGVARARGLETSPTAVAEARARGLDVVAGDLFAHARANPGSYDAVTCFHVLEHVEGPRAFAAALAALCRPGGRVFAAVPHALSPELRGKLLEAPLNCPPHHLSRWRPENLEDLGRRAGLVPVSLELEFEGRRARWNFIRAAEGAISRAVPRGLARPIARAAGWAVLSPPLAALWRRAGLRSVIALGGQSMLAEYRKP